VLLDESLVSSRFSSLTFAAVRSHAQQEHAYPDSHEQSKSAIYHAVRKMHHAVSEPLPNISERQGPQTNNPQRSSVLKSKTHKSLSNINTE
jgi:hypothetical protein